ncbi:MAG: hypothetical protein HDT47_01250 [Ruminococcaceae bacterium]|nr:hypothetical protein [Oscillospiraceae bacterium]
MKRIGKSKKQCVEAVALSVFIGVIFKFAGYLMLRSSDIRVGAWGLVLYFFANSVVSGTAVYIVVKKLSRSAVCLLIGAVISSLIFGLCGGELSYVLSALLTGILTFPVSFAYSLAAKAVINRHDIQKRIGAGFIFVLFTVVIAAFAWLCFCSFLGLLHGD